ncbi:uncharacterized protein LOC128678628 isoform X2 [Plodia interpunctella]|nr:uncharacterized protein LOC128678628 isoform X2 [Plodia interpunctella]XP_053616251.1 uncharacterized protein LOC128678628 isoform X2 [Plodia interpunctella]
MTPCWLFVVSIALMTLVSESYAINCYYCNSANNTACLDLKQYDEEDLARIIPIVDCEKAIPSSIRLNFFCRKIIQTIYHTDTYSSVRVTRSCGWVPSKQPCYHTSNRDHVETVCQCFDDMCNAADHVDPGAMTVLFLVLACILYLFSD